MFDRDQSIPAPPPKGSALAQGISLLGTVAGIGAAILLTPLLFEITKQPLSNYLTKTWGPDLSGLLTYGLGALQLCAIFALTRVLVVVGATAAIVALAARRIPHA